MQENQQTQARASTETPIKADLTGEVQHVVLGGLDEQDVINVDQLTQMHVAAFDAEEVARPPRDVRGVVFSVRHENEVEIKGDAIDAAHLALRLLNQGIERIEIHRINRI